MKSIRQAVEDYIALRRGLGFKLREAADLLRDFSDFLERNQSTCITTDLAVQWAKRTVHARPPKWGQRLSVIRVFAKHRSAADPRTEIPPLHLLPSAYARGVPYIFSERDIRRLERAAKALQPKAKLRRWTYSRLFGLLAVTGLRTGEALGLTRDAVDLNSGILTIRESKFGKSRLVPLHHSTTNVLRRYARMRDEEHPFPKTPAFFVSERGGPVSKSALTYIFHMLRCKIGIESGPGRRRPRLHDLRHAFAVRTILGWYRAGLDVERQMPLLSTYLGHAAVKHTYWYLSAVPELLRWAVVRLETTLGDLP